MRLRWFLLFLFSLAAVQTAADGQRELIVEAGPAWQLRNDFASPGTTGTLVRLDDETATGLRATLFWPLSERWSLRVVAAPLSVENRFTPAAPVTFEGRTFAAGDEVEVDYRFDSWRAGGVYRFAPRGAWSFRAGLTLKVRDAEISLRSDAGSATKSNTGVVPLLYAGARYEMSPRFSIDLDLDGAAASQGRAIDFAIRGDWRVSGSTSFQLGARVLDGGADNDEVYTFATFAYGYAGLSYNW